jgi:phage tail-like protein
MSAVAHDPPVAASARRYLRGNLPAVYHESPDGGPPPVMGLLEGLERVLDPVVALLDNLHRHLEPDIAPADMLDFLAELVGAPVDDTLPPEVHRKLVTAAATIGRTRGTRASLQLALGLAFPELDPRVRDGGEVTTGSDARAVPAASQAAFEVRVSQAPSAGQAAQIARCIADHQPVGITYRIVVGARRSEGR